MNRHQSSLADHAARGTPDPGGIVLDMRNLKAYTRAKHLVASEIRVLQRLLTERGDEKRAAECRELMVKLAEDRFTLAVLGHFKRGKSSLMNAILGRELLPTGVLPLTSVITILKFGPKERLVVEHGRSALFPEEAMISQLASYVTEKGNPGNEKRIKAVYVEVPLPFLRQGIEFVDTPGVGSAIEANTMTTYDFLPQCDAAIFVTSVDVPLTMAEVNFFRQVREHVRKVFLVVNKTDLLGDAERQEVMSYIVKTIQQSAGEKEFSLFPVSSRDGLSAKKSGDQDAYARSGLKDLEQALGDFLSSAGAAAFLTAIVDKAMRLLPDDAPDLAEQKGSSHVALTTARDRFQSLLRQLQAVDLSGMRLESVSPPEKPGKESMPTQEQKRLERAEKQTDLAADLRTRGCPVCQHIRHAAFDFFAQWQNAFASQADVQESFATELGFCPLHTWQMVSVASGRGLSLGYPRLLDRLSTHLSGLALKPDGGEGLLISYVADLAKCRVCRILCEAEEAYVQRLADFLAGEEGRRAYARSQGVCLKHLSMLLPCLQDSEVVSFLLSGAAKYFEECAEDMQRYSIKYDALRRALVNSDEEDAYLRAIVHIAGEKDAHLPRLRKKEGR